MQFKISTSTAKKSSIIIITNAAQLNKSTELSKSELAYLGNKIKLGDSIISVNQLNRFVYIVHLPKKDDAFQLAESIRLIGCQLKEQLNQQKEKVAIISNLSSETRAAYLLAEGIGLASYQFLKYISTTNSKLNSLQTLEFSKDSISAKELNQLSTICEAVGIARDLVNEPLNFLNAVELANQINSLGKKSGFKTTTLNKAQITKEKMGGILAVNRGSIDPPTFSIMEYKPTQALNKKAIVLVGKGIVYDTGGVSLKPTANSMDRMKSDMSGAALVSAAIYAIAKMKLPLHIIALIPATDNRPGENAYVPGDVIKMYDGTTVEVLNTDAEGRMVLADALHWAKRYKPELVLDFATLTGASAAITGPEALVYMGTASEEVKNKFETCGFVQHERMVQLPLWPEYGQMIKSEIADLKNIGGAYGGAITAGKFLEHFTDYPWLHFDVAGVSFASAKKNYHSAGGTAFGLRMLLEYLLQYGK